MVLSQRLVQKQTTQLVMTPQLQQAIKLLQMSNLELSTFIEAEIEENPLLEREDPEGGFDRETDAAPAGDAEIDSGRDADDGAADGLDAPTEPMDSAELATAELPPDPKDAPLDTDYENDWTNDDRAGEDDTRGAQQFADWGGGTGDGLHLEDRLRGETTLRDHLEFQINVQIATPAERMIALALTDQLDESGYFRGTVAEIAERLGVHADAVEAVLSKCQTFDPAGVYARNLAECLAIQLRDRDRFDPAMATLVGHLDLLAQRHVAQIKRLCMVDDADLAEMVAEIRALDPKPGLSFDSTVVQTVVPDILARARGGDGWHIELNADTLPRVLVNQAYFAEVRASARSKAEKDYLNERMASANWLVRALHQRATTILKVASEIVRTQGAFLSRGVQYLKPLTLRDVADVIGMHESTVSRVTSSKFMATPRGVFELKYFFTTAIASTAGGGSHSAESVRYRIREMIARETGRTVLSDDKIVGLLSREGVDIARRTVAKYRESMRIPSSAQRRREKAITL
ncbi:MAG: RNA polymerase factor sigma-54 [Alphaproteobacteria bacterium]|nr:RNA polymerase factor sigma-54 [Alphaproteobacteria bacterium]